MHSIASSAGARRLFATSVIARLPLEMLSIGLVVHIQHLTGSFGAAGVVTGVYAIGLGVGGPLLGQLVDRCGQTLVLLASGGAAAALLLAIALLPTGAPLAVPVALAAGIGLATPPVGACLRTQLPGLLPDPDTVRSAYALEASVVELTWIFGPPLVLILGALLSTGAALAIGGLVLLVATAAFAAQPASRNWRPAPADPRSRGSSLRTPAMRTLVIVLIAVGVLLGAAEVALTAAGKRLDDTTAAAPLFVLWGAGSLAGGLLAARLDGGARSATGLALVLCALTVGHLALIPVSGSVVALGAVLLLAGAAISPTEAAVYAMVDDAAPPGTMTEAFAWLATAIAVGGAIGAASAGMLVDTTGPTAAFALAGCAGGLAVLTTTLRSRTLVLGQALHSPMPTSSRPTGQPPTLLKNKQQGARRNTMASRAISKDGTQIGKGRYGSERPRPRPAERSDRRGMGGPARSSGQESRTTSVATGALAPSGDRTGGRLVTVVFDVAAPIVLYYGLRAAGVGIYLALIAGALAPAITTLLRLIRNRTADGLAVFVMTTMLLGVGVSLIAGSPRFLLAKEGWITGVGAAWFLITARGRRPLAFLFARPLLEGRRAFTGESWDSLWERLPQFRRVWRVSSVIWGIGLLVDAAIRVLIAYSLPIALVPAVGAALYPATFLVLQVLDQINYRHTGLWQILLGRGDPVERPSRHLQPGPAI